MTLVKRVACAMSVTALAFCLSVCLVGCGSQPAATWAHGEISEDEVATVVNNLRTYYGITDDETWASFVKQRGYDTSNQTSDSSNKTAIEQATENGASSEISDELLGANVQDTGSTDSQSDSSSTDVSEDENATEGDGTVEELREYVIEQMIRQRIIDEEIEARNITVSDEEVDEYVDQIRAYVESQYMEGVFESFLQMQGYTDLNQYREEIREQLIQVKMQQEIAGTTSEDGTESVDQDKWKEWLDSMYAYAEVKINPAPSDLPYAIVETAEGSDEQTGEEQADETAQEDAGEQTSE